LRAHQRGAHGVELGNQVHGSRLPRGEAADRPVDTSSGMSL
jgi:hypothetical protein